MTWLDLYNYLNDKANKVSNIGKFSWQQEIVVFDFSTLTSCKPEITTLPDNKIYFSIDTSPAEKI